MRLGPLACQEVEVWVAFLILDVKEENKKNIGLHT
jgi:hypothetical protein